MQRFTIRRATAEEASAVAQLMRYVYENMPDQSLFVCDDEKFVRKHIEDEGVIYIALAEEREVDEDDQLAACLIVRFPGDAEDNLGLDLGLPDGELQSVAHMESVVVHPRYRGNHLQRKLLQHAEEELRKEKKYSILMATVAPANIFSRRAFESEGYVDVMTKIKYEGKERVIYRK